MTCIADIINKHCEGKSPEEQNKIINLVLNYLIDSKGLRIKAILDEDYSKVIFENPKPVEDYKKGNEKALGSLIGKLAKMHKGADVETIKNELIERLK